MVERKLIKSFYEAVKIEVVCIGETDLITTSSPGCYDESSGGNLDPNWDEN